MTDPTPTPSTQIPEDQYWARAEAPALVEELQRRRKDFCEHWRNSGRYSRVKRSYCYYHDLYYEGEDINGAAIKIGGEEAEWDLMEISQYRSLLGRLKNYVTGGDIEWDTIARESNSATLEATKLGNEILDSYTGSSEHKLQRQLKQAGEDGIVLSEGYLWDFWDKTLGDELDAPEDEQGNQRIIRTGDFRFLCPSVHDVMYDLCALDFSDSSWVHVRRLENKWDLIAEHPEHKDEILKQKVYDDKDPLSNYGTYIDTERQRKADHIWVYYFYHKYTPALPKGRCTYYVSRDCVLKNGELRGGCIPVHRFIPAKQLLTSLGYTVGFELQAAQEALHLAATTIVTNQNSLGGNKIQLPGRTPINVGVLEGVGTVIQCDGEIKSHQFCQNAGEFFKSVDLWIAMMERTSGMNAAARGQPEPSLKAARAIEFTEARAKESSSDVDANYKIFCAEVGTSILKILHWEMAALAKELGESEIPERAVTTLSATGQRITKKFNSESLQGLSHVQVVEGNPELATIEGRVRVAEMLVERGIIRDPTAIVHAMKTGDLDTFLELDENQTSLIKAENEAFLRGEDIPPPSEYDLHPSHVRGHLAAFATPQARRNSPALARMLAHNAVHWSKMEDPQIMARVAILYPNQAIPPPLPPSAPPGAPPGMPPGAPPAAPPSPIAPPQPNLNAPPAGKKPPSQAAA